MRMNESLCSSRYRRIGEWQIVVPRVRRSRREGKRGAPGRFGRPSRRLPDRSPPVTAVNRPRARDCCLLSTDTHCRVCPTIVILHFIRDLNGLIVAPGTHGLSSLRHRRAVRRQSVPHHSVFCATCRRFGVSCFENARFSSAKPFGQSELSTVSDLYEPKSQSNREYTFFYRVVPCPCAGLPPSCPVREPFVTDRPIKLSKTTVLLHTDP